MYLLCACMSSHESPFSTWAGIILVGTSLALSCVCQVGLDGPHVLSSDVLCHSALTCWHLPHRHRLCAALITVTADLHITKKSQSSINLLSQLAVNGGDKAHSRRAHTTCTDFDAVECRCEWKHTHEHTALEGGRAPNPKLAGVIIPSVGNDWKLLRVTFVQTGPWFKSLWLYYLVQKKDGFQACNSDTWLLWRCIDMHEAFLIIFFSILIRHQRSIQRACNEDFTRLSSAVSRKWCIFNLLLIDGVLLSWKV